LSGPRRRLGAEQRRRTIVEAAYRLISRKGFKSVSTRMIAREAGINEALIFHYFGNKGDLLNVVVEEIRARRPRHDPAPPRDAEAFFAVMKDLERFFLDLNCTEPAVLTIILYSILEHYPVPDEFNFKAPDSPLCWILGAIKKGKESWGFRKDVDGITAVSMFLGGMIYYVLETSVIGQVKRTRGRERFTELLRRMLE
jgi:AcrR family transcriptional regulator